MPEQTWCGRFVDKKETNSKFFIECWLCPHNSKTVHFSLMQCVRSCNQKPCLHNETKGGVCRKIELIPKRIFHSSKMAAVSLHDRRDVVWTHSIGEEEQWTWKWNERKGRKMHLQSVQNNFFFFQFVEYVNLRRTRRRGHFTANLRFFSSNLQFDHTNLILDS